jgi:hypothetical protein
MTRAGCSAGLVLGRVPLVRGRIPSPHRAGRSRPSRTKLMPIAGTRLPKMPFRDGESIGQRMACSHVMESPTCCSWPETQPNAGRGNPSGPNKTTLAWAIAKAQPTIWGPWGRPTPVSMESHHPNLCMFHLPPPTEFTMSEQLGGIPRFRNKKPLPSTAPLELSAPLNFAQVRGIPCPHDQLESQSHVIMSAGRWHAGERAWPASDQ